MLITKVLIKDENYEEVKASHPEQIIIETEAYFMKLAGDFSRYMTECSDLKKESEIKKRVLKAKENRLAVLNRAQSIKI